MHLFTVFRLFIQVNLFYHLLALKCLKRSQQAEFSEIFAELLPDAGVSSTREALTRSPNWLCRWITK